MRPTLVLARNAAVAALATAMSCVLPPTASSQNASRNVVYCYNESLDLVQNVAPAQCTGRIIGQEEADAVKHRRVEKLRGAVARSSQQTTPGKLAGTGSGFFVSHDGRLITNKHVVDGCAVVTVLPPDLERKEAKVLAVDIANDFALLDVDVVPPAVATFRVPAERAAGQRIALIGYPKNEAIARIQPFFTPGETMQPRQPLPSFLGLQFQADVRPGNSGGPLLDRGGLVLGLVTAKINTVNVAKQTGQVIREVGYATDNDVLLHFLSENGVPFKTAAEGPALNDEALFSTAKGFATRIECWK